jgi:hypothetical protein
LQDGKEIIKLERLVVVSLADSIIGMPILLDRYLAK